MLILIIFFLEIIQSTKYWIFLKSHKKVWRENSFGESQMNEIHLSNSFKIDELFEFRKNQFFRKKITLIFGLI